MASTPSNTPLLAPPRDVAAEHEVDEALLRALLREQHPDLAALPITPFAEGWDNVLFRLGDDWLARLPRRSLAGPMVAQELRWLPELAPRLPLPLPVPVRAGRPGCGFPWQWSISRWIEGGPAAVATLDADTSADALASFTRVLHGLEAPDDAPTSAFRGIPPRERADSLLARLEDIRQHVDAARTRQAWHAASAAPDWTGPRVWCHGDLHPFNLLARDGALCAVLDWGDMHAGEPAPDLAGCWLLLPTSAHARFRAAYGPIDDATWQRGRAWALFFGVMFVAAGCDGAGDNATRLGHTTLERALG